MSDNNVCPICGNQYSSGGICECWPQLTYTDGEWVSVKYIQIIDPEIASLKAVIAHMQSELSNAMAERDEARAELEKAEFEAKRYGDMLDMTRAVRDMLETERDEARRLAREYYQLWQMAEGNLPRFRAEVSSER